MSDTSLRPEVLYFNEKSAAYRAEYDRATSEGYSFRVRREKVLALIPRGQRIVDIASGPGTMIPGLREKGYHITCIDAAPEMIARIHDEYPPSTDLKAYVGDAYALPLPDGAFDVALAMGLIEYLADEDRFLKEAARVIKPGGTLIITFPNYASPWRACNRFFLGIISLFRRLAGIKKLTGVTHREYRARRAKSLLAAHGFSVEVIRYYNFKLILYPLDVWFPRFTVMQSKLFERLDSTLFSFIGTGFILKATKRRV